jgi:hypothetical protein
LKNLLSPKPVLFFALAVTGLCVGVIECQVLARTNGIFSYPLDDTFIHMALARNLSTYGAWGVSPHEFASASSSVLYTLLLATLFKIFSVRVILPFIINCVAAGVLLMVVQRWLRKEGVSGGGQLGILLVVVFAVPLPILIVSGMEHTLQCLFSFLFIFGFSDWLELSLAQPRGNWKFPWPVAVYGLLVTFIRYEGLFLIAIGCLILVWHRKLGMAVRLGLVSVLPLVIFGVFSVLKGSYFLPNSVLLKADPAPASLSGVLQSLGNILIERMTIVDTDNVPIGAHRPGISLLATQRLLIILPLLYLVFLKYIRQRPAYGYVLGILLGGTILQLCLASTGWLYRYEAYLIFCTVVIGGVLIWKYGREVIRERGSGPAWIVGVGLFALGFPLVLRSAAAFSKTGTACVNIYQQQYQMGQFLQRFSDRDAVAANDIGAVSFFTDGPKLDLWGLGNFQVARSRKKGYWGPDFLDSLCRSEHVGTAVVYDQWFGDSLLHRWNKVGSWRIRNNVICGEDSVSFFYIGGDGGALLRQHLKEYEPRLPAGVTVSYY